MTWQRAEAAEAIAGLLEPLDPLVSVFASPPETFNPPAYVVGYPSAVTYDGAAFSIDLATIPVLAAGGLAELDRVDALLRAAKDAITADPSLDGAVMSARVVSQSNWRRLNVAGADILVADLILEIRM